MKKIQVIFLAFAVILVISIFYCSSITLQDAPQIGLKILPIIWHFTMFFMLSFSLFAGFAPKSIFGRIILFFIPTIYAVSDEFHQYFVPGRSCSFFDFSIDFLGIVAGIFFFAIIFMLEKLFYQSSNK